MEKNEKKKEFIPKNRLELILSGQVHCSLDTKLIVT